MIQPNSPLPADPRALADALAAHRRAAYEAGYAGAMADVLASAVYVAEQVLRRERQPADARATLYRFVATLEAETRRLSRHGDLVSDGLGI